MKAETKGIKAVPAGKDERYSEPLGQLIDEAFDCQSLAEGLAALIQAEPESDMTWRLAKALSKRLSVFAGAIDELETHGPSATEAANG